jgi:hypothetical protein
LAAIRNNGRVTLATFAALAAATVSLVNVYVTSRLTRSGQKEQWRRETERPIVANLLTTSEDCLRHWTDAAEQLDTWRNSPRPEGDHDEETRGNILKVSAEAWALHEKLRLLVAELDLVAGAEVRRAAAELEKRHERVRYPANPAGGNQHPLAAVNAHGTEIRKARGELITATRTDIGVEAGSLSSRWRARPAIRPRGRN